MGSNALAVTCWHHTARGTMLSRSHGPPRSFSSVPFACLSFRSFRPHLGSFPSFPFARPECNRLSRSGRANRVVPVVRGSAVDRPVAPLLSHLVSAMLPFCPSLPSGWRQVRPRQGSGSTGRGRQSPREGAKSVVSRYANLSGQFAGRRGTCFERARAFGGMGW